MKLVFFGTPKFAIPSLTKIHNSRHEILAIVTSPDAKLGRGLKMKQLPIKIIGDELNYKIYQPSLLSDTSFIEKLKSINADLFIVVAFKILPRKIISLPNKGAINLHASLLPQYRGAAPIQHAILNGEKQTGVTTFLIETKIDTGDILLQQKYPILQDQIAGNVYTDLSIIGAELLLKTIDKLENNSLNSRKQDPANSSLAPAIKPLDCLIDWTKSSDEIHNQIRALSPLPGAYTFINKKRIKLFASKLSINTILKKTKPGTLYNHANYLTVTTGKDDINIYEVQLEGKKRMPVKSFLSGFNINNINHFG